MLEGEVLEGEVLKGEALITRLSAMEFTDATQSLVLAVGARTGETIHFMIQVILIK